MFHDETMNLLQIPMQLPINDRILGQNLTETTRYYVVEHFWVIFGELHFIDFWATSQKAMFHDETL